MAELKDSGERTSYETGAVRDCKEGKGRFDLMPLEVIVDLVHDNTKTLDNILLFKQTSKTVYLKFAIECFCQSRNWSLWEMLLEVSKHFEDGALKYGENNWQKGIPIHSYIDSALRHYVKYKAGWDDEPHDRAFIWNLLCCIWTMGGHLDMDDFTEKRRTNDVPQMR